MQNSSPDPILDNLNQHQLEAVTAGDGPLLIFAGAGSGKTRVLTQRIAYLLREGDVSPEQVLAVTFTNKAANEMKARIARLVGLSIRWMWVGTFHSVCARLLRQYGARIGFADNFVIFDTDDQTTLVSDCCAAFDIDTAKLKPNAILGRISSAKNDLITPLAYADTAKSPTERIVARVYQRYQEKLAENNALDFDDLIMQMVAVLERCPEVLAEVQEQFRYLFVDEYQDINKAQYHLMFLLAQRYHNLCVVGDDDQSIYSWRGADAQRMVTQFERDFRNADADVHVVKLEQNYRSPQTILDAAYQVICRNDARKEKRLWTENRGGPPIKCYNAPDEHGEGAFIARTIKDLVKHKQRQYKDFAVLYRINAQSRVIEQMMLSQGIPYRVIGGQKFFARKEIKDIIAYLRVMYNPSDSVSLRRIINTPTRGIGATSISRLEELAAERGISLFNMVMLVEHSDLAARTRHAVQAFADMMTRLQEAVAQLSITDLTRLVVEESGYEQALLEEGSVQSRTRLENIKEMFSATQEFENEAEDDAGRSLRTFLEQVSLITDLDAVKEDDNAVTLMTLHAAKGLEYPVVFITGLEESVFPMARAVVGGKASDLEEERRLCYVGITRAREELYCTMSSCRMLFGQTTNNPPSRFLHDISEELLEYVDGSVVERGQKWNWEAVDVTRSPVAEAILIEAIQRDSTGFRTGDRVRHATFGVGIVLATQGSGDKSKVTVNFPKLGVKILVIAYAGLEKL